MNTSQLPLSIGQNSDSPFDKAEWLQDVLSLLEPEARQRFLLRLATFQQVHPRDPLFATLDAMGLLTLAFQRIPIQIANSIEESRGIQAHVEASCKAVAQTATEIRRLLQEIQATVDSANKEVARQSETAIGTTRQTLEDMRNEVSAAISSEAVVNAYETATRERFGQIIDGTIQPAIAKSATILTGRLESWADGVLDQQLGRMSSAVTATLTSVTRDFRVRLYGAWSGLLWAMLGGGAVAGMILFMVGYYLGKQ